MKNINPHSVALPSVRPALTGQPLLLGEVFFMEEIWKDITGYEGLYQASNCGRIKSLTGKKASSVRKLTPSYKYYRVGLHKDKSIKIFMVHRIVLETFIPNIENKPQVNHIDGNGRNNNISNLEWATPSENAIHSYVVLGKIGSCTGKFGKDHHISKPVIQMLRDNNFVKEWDSMSDVYRAHGISVAHIGSCCRGDRVTAGGFKWKFKDNKQWKNE